MKKDVMTGSGKDVIQIAICLKKMDKNTTNCVAVGGQVSWQM